MTLHLGTGPGPYQNILDEAHEGAEAVGTVLLIIRGKHGDGAAIRTDDPRLNLFLPDMLRAIADTLESDLDDPGTGATH